MLLLPSLALAAPPRVLVPTESGAFHASPVDATLPVAPIYPRNGFVARQIGPFVSGIAGVGSKSIDFKGKASSLLDQGVHGLRFNNGGRVRMTLPTAVMAPNTQMIDGKPQPFGMGLSFFYRFDKPSNQRVNGWLPLVSLGKIGAGWQVAVLLRNGIPVIARRHSNGTLFDLSSVAVGHAPTLRIDEGKRHHIVLNFSQTPNPNGCGGQQNAACAGLGWLRLVVDGVMHAEYLVDIDRDYRQIDIGSLDIYSGAYPTQTNWSANPKGLLARGVINDVMLYRRALTMREISQLSAMLRGGLVMQWPTAHPSLLGLQPVTVPGTPGSATPSPAKGFKATSDLLFFRKGFNQAAGELSPTMTVGGTQWTYASTVRNNGQQWLAAVSTFGGMVGIVRKGNTVYGSCGKDWAKMTTSAWLGVAKPTDWSRIAIIQDGSTTRFVHNGQVAKLSCGALSASWASYYARLKTAPASEPAADVANAMLFRRAVPLDELFATAFPGPRVWMRPNTTSSSVVPALAPNLSGGLWNVGGAKTKAPVNGVIGADSKAATLLVSPSQSFLQADGKQPDVRPFTLSMRVKPIKGGTGVRDIRLARRAQLGNVNHFDVDVSLVCDYGGNGCWVYVLTPNGTPGKPSRQWKVDRLLNWNQEALINISWPAVGLVATSDPSKPKLDDAPRIAVNNVLENQLSETGTKHVFDLEKIWKKWGNHMQPTAAAMAPTWWQFGGHVSGDKLELQDVRVYPYAVQAVASIGARCDKKSCGETGQLCAEANGGNKGASAMCYGCATGQISVAGHGAVERECRAQVGFYQQCGNNKDCLSDKCDGNTWRCMASNATKGQCTKFCSDRGRRCDAHAGGWRCGECRAGFKRLPAYGAFSAIHPDLECTWAPTIEDGDPCSSDAQCHSGKCGDVDVPRYIVGFNKIGGGAINNGWQPVYNVAASAPEHKAVKKVKRCLARTPNYCNSKHLHYQIEGTVYTPDCALAEPNTCGATKDCKPVTAYRCKKQCTSNRERRWTILNPATCSAMVEHGLRLRPFAGKPRGAELKGDGAWGQIRAAMTRTNFTLNDLKKAVLRETTNYSDKFDYGRLVNAGVGRVLYEYARANNTDKAKMRSQYGNFGRLIDCPSAAPYKNETYNTIKCEPKLQPRGANCPPPGEPGVGHEWCVTNYCARDTKKCDNGDNPLLEPKPNAGNKDRQGKDDVKFGVVRCDDTTVEMQNSTAKPGDDDYRYVADLTIAYCLRMFGTYVPPIPVLQGLFHLDRTKGEACASYQFKAYVAGVALALGKPKSLFGSCTGMKINNNTICEQAKCTPGPLITGNLSELFKAVAGGAYIQVGGAAPGCVPLAGTPVGELIDKLTILKTKTVGPVPLAVQFGPTLDICVDPLVGVGDEGVPKVTIRPSIGLGIDARGGIGLAEGEGKDKAIKFWAGIQLLLDVVKLGFPIGWGVEVKDVPGNLAMWKLQVSQRIGIDLELFSGSLALFAEVALGPLSIGYRLQLFDWTGLLFEWELSNVPLFSTKLDNRKPKISYGNLPEHDHDGWFNGKKCEGLCGK